MSEQLEKIKKVYCTPILHERRNWEQELIFLHRKKRKCSHSEFTPTHSILSQDTDYSPFFLGMCIALLLIRLIFG
jgi:hypothetical protein